MSSRTRLCRKIFYRANGADNLVECLLTLGKTLPAPGVLFPSGDSQLLCVSRNRELLSDYYHYRAPDPELVELLADKARFYNFVEQRGVDIPITCTNASPDSIAKIASTLRYPSLIKPSIRDDNWAKHFAAQKAFPAQNADALIDLFHKIYSKHREIVIQEIVPGPDSNLFFSHAYLSEELEPLAIWTGRKIRQNPIHFGTSTMTETIWVDEIADTTISILKELRCSGYSSIEFKKDPSDGKYRIMEITQGRTWYPHYLGFGAGVNIPFIWYQDLLGKSIPAPRRAKEGVRWIDEYHDIRASYSYWKQNELSFLDWIRSFKGVKVFAYASLKDPLPFICVILRLLLCIPRAITKKFRQRHQ